MNVENLTTIGLIAVMVIGFYFLIIRPTRNRQKEQARTLDAVGPGVWVMTTTGIIGRVWRTGERQVMIETSPGDYMTVVRQAVMQVLPPEQANEFLDPETMAERPIELDEVDDDLDSPELEAPELDGAEVDPAENADTADVIAPEEPAVRSDPEAGDDSTRR